MIDKIVPTPAQALADVADGATVMIGGFGTAGIPNELVDALIARGVGDLTIINNTAGNGDHGIGALLAAGMVAFALLAWAGPLQLVPLMVLAFAIGAVQTFDTPARQALVLDIVSREAALRALALVALLYALAAKLER